MERRRLIQIIGIIVGIAGVAAPVLWDYYSTKGALELRIESSTILLQADPLLEDVVITYQGQPIEGLTRMDLVLLNTGKTSIAPEDIVAPPAMHFPSQAQIIAATIVRKDPDNLDARVIVTADPPTAAVHFDLLNPTDYVHFAVYLTHLPDTPPVVTARIRGIKEIEVIDTTVQDVRVKPRVSWGTYPVAFVTLLFLFLLALSGREARAQSNARRLLRKDPDLLSKFEDVPHFELFIGEHLSFLSMQALARIKAESLRKAEEEFSPENKVALISAIKRSVNRSGGGELVFYISIITVASGLSFIGWQLWQVFR